MAKKILNYLILIPLVVSALSVSAQLVTKKNAYTHQDTLRGNYGPGRMRWDVLRYNITVKPDLNEKTISGKNIVQFYDTGVSLMQMDMQEPMIIDSAIFNGKTLPLKREGNVYWITIRDARIKFKIRPGPREITLYFHGKPKEAKHAPWDGGWIWTKDSLGRDWATVACQGLGASVWFPCKDHQSDEPDSGASLSITVPDTMVAVGNGRLQSTIKNNDGTATWVWEVKNPINNYDIIPYIGKYVNFSDTIRGEKGKLDLSYWILDYNLEKAKKQFAVVPQMIHCFEDWMGPYPFYEDSYKLVDAPHLGMEHQSAVAYGNKYKMGYLGNDLSGTGWGLKWDFIIVHESGHEWFGNSITAKDIADMWIHESFTNYTETMFTECAFGKKAGSDYVIGIRKNISNDIPIIGPYGVNKEGSGDMYYKGGNMLHTIRQIVDNDALFKNILRGLSKTFYHQTVTSKQIEEYISSKSHHDLSKIFDQYLRTTMIPVLEYKVAGNSILYKWSNVVNGFKMPVKLVNGKWIHPVQTFKKTSIAHVGSDSLQVVPDFYITVKKD